jgi:hypothetical protein
LRRKSHVLENFIDLAVTYARFRFSSKLLPNRLWLASIFLNLEIRLRQEAKIEAIRQGTNLSWVTQELLQGRLEGTCELKKSAEQ